jgi:RES domain-containing protein
LESAESEEQEAEKSVDKRDGEHVPSVLYPEETNLVLNPAHPEFSKIKFPPAGSFAFGPRIA